MDGPRRRGVTRRRREAAFVCAAVAVFVASVLDPATAGAGGPTSGDGPMGVVGVDKWVHATAYATLALLGAFALSGRSSHGLDRWALALVVLGVAAFGAGIEVVQATLPARSFDLVDAAANATGALLGVGAWAALVRSMRRGATTGHATRER